MPVRRQVEHELGGVARNQADEKTPGNPGQPDAAHRPDERQQRALDEELTHDSASAGTDGEAHSHLFLPRRRARQQQARDVRAGDEKYQPDDGHQHQERLPVDVPEIRPAGSARMQLEHRFGHGFSARRWPMGRDHRACYLGPDRIQSRGGLRNRNARLRPREDAQPEVSRAEERRSAGVDLRKRGDRNRDVGDRSDVGAGESSRAHADNRDRNPVQLDSLPDRAGTAPMFALPVPVADYRHQGRAGLIVFAAEETTRSWLQAERVVVAAGDERAGRSTDRVRGNLHRR